VRAATTWALLVAVLALVGSMAALAYTAVTDQDRIDDIERTVREVHRVRAEAEYRDCVLENRRNIAVREFVTQVSPQLGLRVRGAFPVREC